MTNSKQSSNKNWTRIIEEFEKHSQDQIDLLSFIMLKQQKGGLTVHEISIYFKIVKMMEKSFCYINAIQVEMGKNKVWNHHWPTTEEVQKFYSDSLLKKNNQWLDNNNDKK